MTKEQQDALSFLLLSKAGAVRMYDDAFNADWEDYNEEDVSAWEGVIEDYDHEIAMIQKEIRNEKHI